MAEVKNKKLEVGINKLHPQHPHRVRYEKEIRRAGRERVVRCFKSGTHSYSIALFVGLFMVVPMFFMTPLSHERPPVFVATLSDASPMRDLLNGMGGPEMVPVKEVPVFEQFEEYFEESDSQFSVPTEDVGGPLVTITKTFNHLKVANTIMPTTSPEITSNYGWRTPPCNGCSAEHKGVDFVPGYGEPVFAVADGMVIDMGTNGGYGNYVKLQHLISNSEGVMEEWVTLYAHMKNDSFPKGLKIGSVVQSGNTIGAVGSTGMSTGPHLHFELFINGENIDPLPLIGTYKVIIVSEEDYADFLYVGETFKKVEKVVSYE
jgi:hypothetical protein